MGIFSVKLKTNSKKDITNRFDNLKPCAVHGCLPSILEIVAGRKKEKHFVAVCKDENCGKISTESAEILVGYWNSRN